MAKEAGMGDQLYVGGFDLSGDAGAVQTIATRRALLDVTAINKSAMERISGLKDGEVSFNSWFDTATDQEHDALKGLVQTDRIVMYGHGSVVGNQIANLNAKQVDYKLERRADAALEATIQALGSGSPVEWGEMLTTGKQTFTGAGAGTSVDYTVVSTAFGAVGYLQVFSFTGTSVTVAIQDSADNAAFANITGLVFTAATGRTQERLATGTTATIRRYVRINLTGTFTSAVIAVGFVKFDAAQG